MLWCCCAGLRQLHIHCAVEDAVNNPSVDPEVLACLTALTDLEKLAVHEQDRYATTRRLQFHKQVSCMFDRICKPTMPDTRCCCTSHIVGVDCTAGCYKHAVRLSNSGRAWFYWNRQVPSTACHSLPSHCMHLQGLELPVWRQLQQHCESLLEGRDAQQQDEGTAAAAAADGDAATG
jgi:hypothetical protein